MCISVRLCVCVCVLCSGGRQEEDLCASGVTLLNQDLCSALKTLQEAQSAAIGAPKVKTLPPPTGVLPSSGHKESLHLEKTKYFSKALKLVYL